MYAPGALWTAAHHEIPLLTVMHNNRGYHQEVMHVQRLSNRRNRVANLGKTMGPVGTSIENPNIDYAKHGDFDGRVVDGTDHRSEGARAGLEEGGRGCEERPAGSSRHCHAAALRETAMNSFFHSAVLGAGGNRRRRPLQRRHRGRCRQGQGRLRQERLLPVPRLCGARRRRGRKAGAETDAVRGIRELRAARPTARCRPIRSRSCRTRTSPISTPMWSRYRRAPDYKSIPLLNQ